mmetsp:Transcript_64434/g.185163  ORF Transcript_64434/g.185163 Transcript_64434/m.185163 type:complete len:207 (+) Transcript_64434:315-935(+)
MSLKPRCRNHVSAVFAASGFSSPPASTPTPTPPSSASPPPSAAGAWSSVAGAWPSASGAARPLPSATSAFSSLPPCAACRCRSSSRSASDGRRCTTPQPTTSPSPKVTRREAMGAPRLNRVRAGPRRRSSPTGAHEKLWPRPEFPWKRSPSSLCHAQDSSSQPACRLLMEYRDSRDVQSPSDTQGARSPPCMREDSGDGQGAMDTS